MLQSKINLNDLNKWYQDAETADNEVFAEYRSNLLLVAGEHYSKKGSKYWERIRSDKGLADEQKLRLTKNHIQKITKAYINTLIEKSPSIKVTPKNSKENRDIKSAQLFDSLWQDARDRFSLDAKILEWAKDYIEFGETHLFLYFDPSAGDFMGYEQAVDEMGQPVVDEQGQPAADDAKPRFQGAIKFERILPFNLLRDASATNYDDCKHFIMRKMVPLDTLKQKYADKPDLLKQLSEGEAGDQWSVFNGDTQNYTHVKDMVLLKHAFIKPCGSYPMGYQVLYTSAGILEESELPFGLFPIISVGFDSVQTSPRHRSIIKQLRPYQIEINRSASKIAETQITSDNKLLVQSGTKIASGGHLPGIRAIQYTGQKPDIMKGESGEQYVGYANSQITEMYQIANVAEEIEQKDTQADPWGMLFRSVKDKKKFTIYSDKFEDFLKKVSFLYFELARRYMTDEEILGAIGHEEIGNLVELRSSEKLFVKIKIEPMSDDINTMMGKQLSINHLIQFAGAQLSKDDIGKMVRSAPFGNMDEMVNDMTLDYDSALNFITALERGEQPAPSDYDNAQYMIKKLTGRVRQGDFRALDQSIQQNFNNAIQIYQQIETQNQEKILAANSEYIPSGGALIACDYYVSIDNSTGGKKTERARVPAESIEWLLKRLSIQGSSQERLGELPQGALAQMSDQLMADQQQMGMSNQTQMPLNMDTQVQ